MKIQVTLVGTSPLLMHHPQMADPAFEINRLIKELTAKRKKTDADQAQIGRLEWFGGIYTMTNGGDKAVVSQPASKVRKCFINTARISKQGKQVERAISFHDLDVPLQYDGPKELEALYEKEQFRSRLSVGVSGRRIMRVRPRFLPWALVLNGTFIEDAGLNFDDLERIVELAGLVEGIGDNRVNGYGRFTGKVKQI